GAHRADARSDARHLRHARARPAVERRLVRRHCLVETALTRAARSYAAWAAGALMVALLAALALIGPPPGLPQLHFEARGIVQAQPSSIDKVEIRTGQDLVGFRRTAPGSWVFDRPDGLDAPSELASH